jgi:hypothetical protein
MWFCIYKFIINNCLYEWLIVCTFIYYKIIWLTGVDFGDIWLTGVDFGDIWYDLTLLSIVYIM